MNCYLSSLVHWLLPLNKQIHISSSSTLKDYYDLFWIDDDKTDGKYVTYKAALKYIGNISPLNKLD